MAVLGSKLEGTAFDMPQIVQIHVAFVSRGGAGDGTIEREGEPGAPIAGEPCLGTGLRSGALSGLGKSVIFALDFRKPA